MSLGPILSVTVGVPALRPAVDGYRSLLGLELVDSDGSSVLLGRPGASHGRIRIVEAAAPGEPPAPFTTLGWAALEVLVADADEALRRCRSNPAFRVLQEPAPVGSGGRLRALQAAGPGGEGVYLTQVVEPPPGFILPRLPAGECLVYGVVAASSDLERTRRRFLDLGLRQVTDHPLRVRVINAAFGLPEETEHRVSSLQLEGEGLVEIDQYPGSARPRTSPLGLRSACFASAEGGLSLEIDKEGT
jgi:catechol 2,3-dioxygenase-like lactoylglutathione lyase family enzyme